MEFKATYRSSIGQVLANDSAKLPTMEIIEDQNINHVSCNLLSVLNMLLRVPLIVATLRFTMNEKPSLLVSTTQSSPDFCNSDPGCV